LALKCARVAGRLLPHNSNNLKLELVLQAVRLHASSGELLHCVRSEPDFRCWRCFAKSLLGTPETPERPLALSPPSPGTAPRQGTDRAAAR